MIVELFKNHVKVRSMSRRENCYAIAMVESFFQLTQEQTGSPLLFRDSTCGETNLILALFTFLLTPG